MYLIRWGCVEVDKKVCHSLKLMSEVLCDQNEETLISLSVIGSDSRYFSVCLYFFYHNNLFEVNISFCFRFFVLNRATTVLNKL